MIADRRLNIQQGEVIHASSAEFNGREREYVLDCLNRGWITQGYYVKRFEELFAQIHNVKYALACSSGTSALHLALLSLNVNHKDAVIVPALTYVATANAARYCGAKVVFCDVNPDDWCLDSEKCKNLVLRLTVAGYRRIVVMPVHLYDSFASFDYLYEGSCVWTVEDAAHVPGTYRLIYPNGLAAFSMYGSKIISCGEGGMVVTNNRAFAESITLYRGQGAQILGKYYHSVVGYNYRMTDLQAAIGLAQLEQLQESLLKRRQLSNLYGHLLERDLRITFQGGVKASAWTVAILIPENVDRNDLARKLLSAGIETRPFFEPLSSLPMYRDASNPNPCPTATSIARRGLCLPMHTGLSDQDVHYVCERLQEMIP